MRPTITRCTRTEPRQRYGHASPPSAGWGMIRGRLHRRGLIDRRPRGRGFHRFPVDPPVDTELPEHRGGIEHPHDRPSVAVAMKQRKKRAVVLRPSGDEDEKPDIVLRADPKAPEVMPGVLWLVPVL